MAIQNPKRRISIMPRISPLHATASRRLTRVLNTALRGRVHVDVRLPVQLGDWSEPQPDSALLRWRDDFYASAAPRADDIALVVEIANPVLGYDRQGKISLYARHRISECWVLDVRGGTLAVHRQPGPEGYRDVQRLRRGDSVSPAAFPDVVFAVADFVGPLSVPGPA